MEVSVKTDAPGDTGLQQPTLDELVSSGEAARVSARLARKSHREANEAEPVRVAAFNSFI
jgi:hypothetical protein